MEPSVLDKLLVTSTYVEDEVAQEAQDIGIPAEGRVPDNEYLQRISDTLNRISLQLQYQQPDDLESSTALSTAFPLTLSTRGRKYTNILMAGSPQQINIFVPGVGTYQVTLAAGWNTLGSPDRSDISLGVNATVNTLPIRIKYSNVQYGGSIL